MNIVTCENEGAPEWGAISQLMDKILETPVGSRLDRPSFGSDVSDVIEDIKSQQSKSGVQHG